MPEIQFSIRIEEEDHEPDGEFDGEGAEEIVAEIKRRYNSGELWAWCFVIVTASIEGCPITGTDTLGGCSYFGGEEEFKQAGGYFEDMKQAAIQNLESNLREAIDAGKKARKFLRQVESL